MGGAIRDEQPLLDAFIAHERQYWNCSDNSNVSERAMSIALTILTLVQGCASNRQTLEQLLAAAPYILESGVKTEIFKTR
jgi:hypothetical protein